MKPEIYVSTDIEADGPIPGQNSMLSLGSVVFDGNGDTLGLDFEVNLETIEGATEDPDTMAFWAKNPAAWTACRANQEHPLKAMVRYAEWLESLPGNPVFVGYPASYDFMFVYWYLMRFAQRSPFGFAALDVKSYAMAVLGTDFKSTTKRNMPRRWTTSDKKHTHVALDDALEQGELFSRIRREVLARKAYITCP